jgi:hypothetical protein
MRIRMLPLILPMITILSIGSCKTTNRNSSLASAELDLAVNAVAKEIEEKFWIQTLVADTHFYHWAPRANVTKNLIPSAADAQNYVRATDVPQKSGQRKLYYAAFAILSSSNCVGLTLPRAV